MGRAREYRAAYVCSDCSNSEVENAGRFPKKTKIRAHHILIPPTLGHNRNSPCNCGANSRRECSAAIVVNAYLETVMDAISSVAIHAIPETQTGVQPLTIVALLCGVVLGASLCVATYGLDLSAGFF